MTEAELEEAFKHEKPKIETFLAAKQEKELHRDRLIARKSRHAAEASREQDLALAAERYRLKRISNPLPVISTTATTTAMVRQNDVMMAKAVIARLEAKKVLAVTLWHEKGREFLKDAQEALLERICKEHEYRDAGLLEITK